MSLSANVRKLIPAYFVQQEETRKRHAAAAEASKQVSESQAKERDIQKRILAELGFSEEKGPAEKIVELDGKAYVVSGRESVFIRPVQIER